MKRRKNVETSWNGRIYVDEPELTKTQYETFFERREYGISFEIANQILKNRQEGFLDEVVPADELTENSRREIMRQVKAGKSSGTVELNGITLDWNWDYEIYRDDKVISHTELEDFEIDKILTDMLDNQCVSGLW